MSRPNPFLLTGFLLVFIALFGGISILQGGLYLDTHEGDTYHLLDILLRMEQGLRPHTDFVTPLGLFAFLPIVLLMQAGLGVGAAILWAQIAVAVLLLPATVYAATSRLPRRSAYAFGAVVLGFVLALTYGGGGAGTSISMHYNRWAWAVSFIMLVIAVLPARGRRHPIKDGIIIGLSAAVLLLIKVTFFVTLLPAVIIAMLWRGEVRAVGASVISGTFVLLLVTLPYGMEHWGGYVADLLNVTRSEVRPYVGVPFNEIMAGPFFIGGVVVVVLTALLLRGSGNAREGTLLILLIPAFLYITYQNFGNDPKWLLFIPFLLVALWPDEESSFLGILSGRDAAAWLSVAAVAFFLPSLVSLALSPLNHAAIRSGEFLTMLPGRPDDADIFIRKDRANTMTAEIFLDERMPVWAEYSEDAGRQPEMSLGGIEWPHCELLAGSRAFFVEIASDLEASGIPEGSQLFTTDILTAFWLFGPFDPLQGGAPWYYSGLSGFQNADFVLAPKCAFVTRVQRIMIEDIEASGAVLSLVRDNDLYALYSISR